MTSTPRDVPATHDGAGEAVLAVVDRTFIVAFPIIAISLVVGLPANTSAWTIASALAVIVAGLLAVVGRVGALPWRATAYAILAVVTAVATLWTLGPLTGVGVTFGIAVLLAGAFLSARGLVAVVTLCVAAIVVRAALGGPLGLPGDDGLFAVPVSLWVGTALACGAMLWIATRVLSTLMWSLEASYARAAMAYRDETAMRAKLDGSRQELEELAQVELVGRLAAGVAHDVNNALAAILAATDVLADEVRTPDQRRDLAELEAASHHAAELVRDLLWIGRKFPASTRAVSELGAAMRACEERIARVARAVVIDVEVEASLEIEISPEHLEQVLFGLIVGAHRAGANRLGLVSGVSDDRIELVLRAIDSAAHAGAPRRAMRARLSVQAATELVTQCGGTLTTAAEGELVVTVSLPRARGRRRLQSEPRPPMSTALVVDDEPMILRRLCQLVARRGYTVTSATTVAEGIAMLAAEPSLLVTDLQLPDGSGEEIVVAALALDPQRPVVVCSGFDADGALQERLRHGRVTYLPKPFTAAQLESVIPLAAEQPVAR